MAAMVTMVLLKRNNVKLDRDVIFLSEAGEFEKLATISTPEAATRYQSLFDSVKAPTIHEYMAEDDPGSYSRAASRST